MHTTQWSLARPCTTNHHASKRRATVWSALLSVLILTAAVVAPAVAAPPLRPPTEACKPFVTGANKAKSCQEIATGAARKVKEATGSDSQAQAEYNDIKNKCLECRR